MTGKDYAGMFTPELMTSQSFALSGKTVADAYRAEMHLVRMDSLVGSDIIASALNKVIARIEALASIRIEGHLPQLRTLIELENASVIAAATPKHPAKASDELSESRDASIEAFRYLQTIHWLRSTVTPDYEFTPQTFLDIHSRCVYGKPAILTGVTFRKKEYRVSETSPAYPFYTPPSAGEIPALIEDLCSFINKEVYSPSEQAGFAHFQFEGIKPFKTALDRTGRAMCHAIYYKRDLVHHIVPPIGLLPAIDTRSHAESLLPYDMGINMEGQSRTAMLDRWVRFCAISTELAARVIQTYIDTISAIEESWNERLGKVSRESAVSRLLLRLPGDPLITVESAMAYTGRGFSATNDALMRLEQAGIIRIIGKNKGHERVFEAGEVFQALEEVDNYFLVGDPLARSSFEDMRSE